MANSSEVWTVKAALDWTVGYLERKGDENPRLSAEWLLAEALGMRRVELYVNFDRPLSMDERDIFRAYVSRRGAGEPLQYITGEVAFRHIAVKVAQGVLIPRPETEVLVSEALATLPPLTRRCALDSLSVEEQERVLALSRESSKAGAGFAHDVDDGGPCGVTVADICTGTGCIACSIAYERPDARVVATDISPEAVKLAGENARALQLDEHIEVMQCDLAGPLVAERAETFDLVVSNPPYIPDDVMKELLGEVAHFEPRLALAGGADGLDIFRRLVVEAMALLKPGGAFACELHEGHLEEAASYACEQGFEQARVVEDLAGRPRILVARKPA